MIFGEDNNSCQKDFFRATFLISEFSLEDPNFKHPPTTRRSCSTAIKNIVSCKSLTGNLLFSYCVWRRQFSEPAESSTEATVKSTITSSTMESYQNMNTDSPNEFDSLVDGSKGK